MALSLSLSLSLALRFRRFQRGFRGVNLHRRTTTTIGVVNGSIKCSPVEGLVTASEPSDSSLRRTAAAQVEPPSVNSQLPDEQSLSLLQDAPLAARVAGAGARFWPTE